MAEIRRVFNAGRMNKDLDERLVPNGEYRDALNVQLASTDGDDAGAIQNMLGNSVIDSGITFSNPKFLCSVTDSSTEDIYWVVKDDTAVYILAYNEISESVSVIVQDNGNTVFKFEDDLITGITIFERQIAITDDFNEPYLIDIDYFTNDQNARRIAPDFNTEINNNGTWQDLTTEDVTVIKKKPCNAPNVFADSNVSGVADPIFELDFVRFAYRWKFNNGQYSVFSPFSEVAFQPGTYEFNMETGFNVGMENRAKEIELTNIEYQDVNNIESLDILMKKSNDQSVYVVETIPFDNITGSYTLTSEQIYSLTSSDQLTRLWDAVPLKAKTVESSANRLIYGNYELGEDTDGIVPDFDISLTTRPNWSLDRKSIKTHRTYQFGVVFEDEYGRQTPVIANKSGSINVPFGVLDNLEEGKQFTVEMQDTLPTNNFANFKYFIKNTSNQYYNVVVESVFPNWEKLGTNEVWLALPSTEINKFEEGDFLLLKKNQGSSLPVANASARFKVLDVENEAPYFIGENVTPPSNIGEVTNFDYVNYDPTGKFFVKLNDINGILNSLFTTNPGTTDTTSITLFGSGSFPQGFPLGYYFQGTQPGTGEQYYLRSFNSNLSGSGSGVVEEFVYTNPSTSTEQPGYYPVGTQVNSSIEDSNGSVVQVIPEAGYDWYKAGVYTTPEGEIVDIYTQWFLGTPPQAVLSKVLVVSTGQWTGNADPTVFETEPEDSPLDLYYETEECFDISEYGNVHNLRYFNCFNFGNGVESDRIRDDFNAVFMDKQVRVSTVLAEQYKRVRNKQGLIWSGIFNSRNSFNRLNQFLSAEGITKDLNPEYGSIQLLHGRDTDLITFCEDKVLRILANKDALYNADGSTNITASNTVLGQAVPYVGEFGISKNPESFSYYGYQAYFTDRARGAVLRLSRDGLTNISSKNMSSYFRDKLETHNGLIIGSYDIYTKQYILSFEDNESLGFSESVNGWTSRFSFVPQSGEFLNGNYFTFNDSQLWKHNSLSTHNNFYGDQYQSTLKFIFNESPGSVKNFKTINYSGTASKTINYSAVGQPVERRFSISEIVANQYQATTPTVTTPGWFVDNIVTDLQSGSVDEFIKKEGKYFNNITGTDTYNVDTADFFTQGLGTPSDVSGDNITFANYVQDSVQVGDTLYYVDDAMGEVLYEIGTVDSVTENTVTCTSQSNTPTTSSFILFSKNNKVNTNGLIGYFAEVDFINNSTTPAEVFYVGSEIFESSK